MPSPAQWRGKSTFMKILTGELDSTSGSVTRPKKMGVLRQDQFAFDEYRVIDTVIMGNAALWKALEERDALYAKPHEQLTDATGCAWASLRNCWEEGGYTAEADAAVLLDGLGVEGELHERKMGELQAGKKYACCWRRRCLETPRRCCWMSRRTTWTWIPSTGCNGIFASMKAC